jgi:hypothetical protein
VRESSGGSSQVLFFDIKKPHRSSRLFPLALLCPLVSLSLARSLAHSVAGATARRATHYKNIKLPAVRRSRWEFLIAFQTRFCPSLKALLLWRKKGEKRATHTSPSKEGGKKIAHWAKRPRVCFLHFFNTVLKHSTRISNMWANRLTYLTIKIKISTFKFKCQSLKWLNTSDNTCSDSQHKQGKHN